LHAGEQRFEPFGIGLEHLGQQRVGGFRDLLLAQRLDLLDVAVNFAQAAQRFFGLFGADFVAALHRQQHLGNQPELPAVSRDVEDLFLDLADAACGSIASKNQFVLGWTHCDSAPL
jgi:hypothetical protein